MRNPPDDSTPAARNAARHFIGDLREHAAVVGTAGWVSVPELVRRAAEDAARKAGDWPTRSGRHRFLVELASEARSEWRVQPGPDGPKAKFYDALSQRISEMAEAERG